jgi:hypothetical protein
LIRLPFFLLFLPLPVNIDATEGVEYVEEEQVVREAGKEMAGGGGGRGGGGQKV